MALKSQLKKLVTGLTVPQEYCCLELEKLQFPLSVFLTLNNQDFQLDVSRSHLFLGYKPLIIGLPCHVDSKEYERLQEHQQICLNFVQDDFESNTTWHDFPTSQNCVARLVLRKIGKKIQNDDVVFFYVGEFGQHSFLNSLQQVVNRQREKLHKQAPNNVGLPGNLVDQVRIAYAVPRSISIITVSDGALINMFPTDLHGPIGNKLYAGSLRIGGMANDEVENCRRLVLSAVETSSYKHTYALGKNHMMELRGEEQFLLHHERSEVFNFPLPASVVQYRELEQVDSFDHGIHRIHLYEVINQKELRQGITTLAHIHQYYAQWRIDRGFETQLFFR